MTGLRRSTARRVLRRAIRRWAPKRPVVLMYHRVAEVACDPWGLAVSPERFAQHLAVLRDYGRCLAMRDLAGAAEPPRPAVVVTFDDGYVDNLHNAKALLERAGLPATFFLSSGLLDPKREFWWDQLERVFLQPGTLPSELELVIDGQTRRWLLSETASYPDEAWQRHRGWKAWEPPPTERQALYLEIWERLRPLPAEQRAGLIDRISAWAGIAEEARPTHRPMSRDEAAGLGGGLIEIGAHTVTHPLLPALPPAAQEGEIRLSKASCEVITGAPVTSFSYPFGQGTESTLALVKDAGFASACASSGGPVARDADRFRLPRVHVQDWDAEDLARRLAVGFAA